MLTKMKFNNHCTIDLYNEAKRIIGLKNWHPTYKNQHLSRVEYILERGQMIDVENGMMSIPFKISDVESIVN